MLAPREDRHSCPCLKSKLPLATGCSETISTMEGILRKYVLRDLYQPHPWWGFDGPYTRLQMDDGSSFIFIMSSVWKAKTRPYLCHASYAPLPHMQSTSSNEINGFACDFYPNAMGITRRRQYDQGATAAFTQTAFIPEQDAVFKLHVDDGRQIYDHHFTHPDTKQQLKINVDIKDNTSHSLLGPMWIARFLPIPLKWHIFSTRSKAVVTISEGDNVLLKKTGLAHQEKNWGIGEPLLAGCMVFVLKIWFRLPFSVDMVSRVFYSREERIAGHSRRSSDILPASLHGRLPISAHRPQLELWAGKHNAAIWLGTIL